MNCANCEDLLYYLQIYPTNGMYYTIEDEANLYFIIIFIIMLIIVYL